MAVGPYQTTLRPWRRQSGLLRAVERNREDVSRGAWLGYLGQQTEIVGFYWTTLGRGDDSCTDLIVEAFSTCEGCFELILQSSEELSNLTSNESFYR